MPSLLSWRAAGPRRRMSFWPASLRSPAAPPPSPLVLQRGEKAGVSASDSSEQQPDEAKAGWQAFERNSAESREHMHAPIDRQGQRKRQACGAAPRSAVNKTVPQCGSSVNDAGGCRAPACLMRRNSMQGRPAWWHASLYTEKRPYACKRSDAAFSKQEEVGDDEATARKWEHAAAANSPTFPLSLPLVRSFLASFLCNRSNGFPCSLSLYPLPAQTDREPSRAFVFSLCLSFCSLLPNPIFLLFLSTQRQHRGLSLKCPIHTNWLSPGL